MPGTLGISPGTRVIGVAVIQNRKIAATQVHSFGGKWSTKKLLKICNLLTSYMKMYHASAIAIKIPDELPVSRSYVELIGGLNVFFERHTIQPVYYTLSELKQHCCPKGKANKNALAECMAVKYPDLFVEYAKAQDKRDKYYHKLFEAVAAARLLHTKMQD